MNSWWVPSPINFCTFLLLNQASDKVFVFLSKSQLQSGLEPSLHQFDCVNCPMAFINFINKWTLQYQLQTGLEPSLHQFDCVNCLMAFINFINKWTLQYQLQSGLEPSLHQFDCVNCLMAFINVA